MPWPISLYQRPLAVAMIDAGVVPKFELGNVSTGAVAARNEWRRLVLDRFQRRQDVLAPDAGGIGMRTDQHEVIVHHRVALDAETIDEEFFFSRLGVHEHHIGVPTPSRIERLAGALGDDFHVDTGLLLEDREQISERPRILRRCRRRDSDGFLLRAACGDQRAAWRPR